MARVDFADVWQKKKKIDLITQAEASESGLASLVMIANFHGHDLDMTAIRRAYPNAGTRGLSVKDLVDIAGDLQFVTQPLKLQMENIQSLSLPCIVQFPKGHFVVLSAIRGSTFHIHDPVGNEQKMNAATFAKMFSGIALELAQTSNFKPTVARAELKIGMIASRVSGLGSSFGLLLLICAGIFSLSLALPFYSMMIMDEGVNSRDTGLLTSIFLAGLVVTILKSTTEYLRDRVVLYMGGQFTLQSNRNMIRHILRLPMSYFETRHAADILARLDAMDEVKKIVTEDLAKAIIDGIILTSTFCLLILYCWQLSFIVIGTAVLSTIYRFMIFPRYQGSQSEMLAATAQEQSTLMETIRGIQSIKLYAIEADRLDIWNRIFSRKLNSSIGANRSSNSWVTFDSTVAALQGVIVLYLGAGLVLKGQLTIGILVAFMGYKDQFIPKFLELLQQAINFRMLKIHLERLSDILLQETEPQTKSSANVTLTGALELKNIMFRYTPNDPLLFNDLCLTLEPGDSIAIVGPSGAGKSTLLKIMLGLILPQSGDILADNQSIKRIQTGYRKGIATVMQDDCILSGTIMENISFFDRNPDVEHMMKSAQDACIHADIMKMPMGYQSLVSDYNNTISGGQKQRILIARALYRKPKIIFMDEATSALDVKNEKLVNDGMKRLGVTRVIVAHRPATINSADKVYVLEGGKVRLRDAEEDAKARKSS